MSSNGTANGTPKWAKQWATFYGARQAHAFIFYFNIYDLHQGRTVKEYLTSTLAQSTRSGQPLDCVIVYNRATGFEFPTETMREAFVKAAGLKREAGAQPVDPILGALGIGNQNSEELPTAPGQALPLIDKVLRSDLLAAVIVEYAELLAPQSEAGQMSVEDRNSLAILHRWGGDRELAAAGQTVCLLTASLPALSTDLRAASSRYEAIKVDLPKQAERLAYIGALRSATEEDDDGVSRLLFTAGWQVQPEYFARVTAGLGLIHIRDILYRAEQEGELTAGLIKERKDRIISSEYADVLEMIEPKYGWERIGGLAHVKDFFARNVIRPMQEGRYNRVPMGVLMTGPAGCLAKGTPVLRYDGVIVPVEDIEQGDLLMGPDSQPRRVRSLCRGREMMYRVTPQKGEPYIVNESHILSLKMSYGAGWKSKGEIVNISIRDYLKQSNTFRHAAKGWRTGVEYPEHALPIEPYVLGLWLGDGSSAAVRVTTPDSEVVQALVDFSAENDLAVTTYSKPNNTAVDYKLIMASNLNRDGNHDPNWMLDEMRGLDLLNNKHIPHVYLVNSRQNRLALLAGLLDTDGHLSCNGYEIVSKYDQLADGILCLARSLGFSATDSTKWVNGKPYHRIFISGHVDEIPLRIQRKSANPRRQKKDVLVTGIAVEPVGVDDYYGFELDGDHLFLLGDFTVTHNTGKSAVAVAVAKEAGINAVELKMSRILGKFVGDSERNLETALSAIESLSPTIVFMDEIDQTLRRGESGDSGVGNRVFSRLLEFMADTSHRGKIVFLAATNRPDLIDAALRRPGRFDRKIPFLVPDGEEREAIFRVMARTYGLDSDLDVPAEAISRTENWTGAEIEAAIIKAAELMEDDGMSAPAAVAEAARRLRPSTAQIDFMTKLALAECNDPDLLPERYRRSLDDRPQLEEEIAQTRKRGERGRELNLG